MRRWKAGASRAGRGMWAGGAGAARRGGRVSRREPRAVGPRVWSRSLWGLHVWEPVETRRAEMELPETAGRGRSVCGKDGVV